MRRNNINLQNQSRPETREGKSNTADKRDTSDYSVKNHLPIVNTIHHNENQTLSLSPNNKDNMFNTTIDNEISDKLNSKLEKHIFETMRIKNVKTPVLQTKGKYEIKLRRGAKIVIGQNIIPVNELYDMFKY